MPPPKRVADDSHVILSGAIFVSQKATADGHLRSEQRK